MRKTGRLFLLLFLIGSTAILAGCYSVPADSDIPWNAPQGWEGSPYIPGLSE